MKDQRLSENFRLSEFVNSQTANRHNIDNWPNDKTIINNLKTLCRELLQPLRYAYDRPISISSGYRCIELNRKLGSKDTSQHTKGLAVDFEIFGVPNKEVAEFIRDNFNFDQLILEFWYEEEPNSGWIHISYVDDISNRNETLTINKNGVFKGFRSE